jgi:hypothetical protein
MFCFQLDLPDGWEGPGFQLQSVQDVNTVTIQVVIPLEGHRLWMYMPVKLDML